MIPRGKRRRRRWRIWRGISEPWPCPLCVDDAAPIEPVEIIVHLWRHEITAGAEPRNPDSSGLCPCCRCGFGAQNGVARHLRELYDAGQLEVHVVEAAARKAFSEKSKGTEAWSISFKKASIVEGAFLFGKKP